MSSGALCAAVLACTLAPLFAAPEPQAPGGPTDSPPDRTPVARARLALDLLLSGKYSELRALGTPAVRAGMTDELLRMQVAPQLKSLGKVEEIENPRVRAVGEYQSVIIPVRFAAARLGLQFTFDKAGRLAGMHMVAPDEAPPPPLWQHPPYSDPLKFRERDVTVGDGEWKLPGTLTVPAGKGPWPAVVLVHGSGPNDRDETITGNKPFKDLAEGLASRGIAVLRYEKRTRHYSEKIALVKGLTVREESIDDAVKAAALLRAQEDIDPKRVFVLGHSLGGYVAPRIAAADGRLAGLILMAGSARPLEDVIVDQVAYAAELHRAGAAQVEEARERALKVKALRPGATGPSPIPAVPLSYLIDLQSYDPPAEAKKLTIPILVLQGERDFQVTMKDFALWKAALGGRKNCEFHAYPALNHLFMAGEGKGWVDEYEKPGHVAEAVIADIAAWVLR